LRQIVKLALKFGQILSHCRVAYGFNIQTLLRFFTLKSTSEDDKTAYYLIVKQYLAENGMQWEQVSSMVFSAEIVNKMKALIEPSKICQLIGEIQDIADDVSQTFVNWNDK
jgi:hypothetical protein